MEKENRFIMLIGIISIIVLCMVGVAVSRYFVVPVPEQSAMSGSAEKARHSLH